jgi:hypothetical protein
VTRERFRRLLAWSALLGAALVGESLFQAVATAGTSAAERATPSQVQVSGAFCKTFVGWPVNSGENAWLTEARAQCANLAP